MPWMVSGLLIGTFLAFYNPFYDLTSSSEFGFIAQLGMYLLLFLVGMEIDLGHTRIRSGFVLKNVLTIVLLETVVMGSLVHFVFGYSWIVSGLVSLSFASVGQTLLVPILDRFGILNSRLGHSIIGVGTLINLIEILTVIIVSDLLQAKENFYLDAGVILISLMTLVILMVGLLEFKKTQGYFSNINSERQVAFILFVFFLFLAIGNHADVAPVAALMAGIALRAYIPQDKFSDAVNYMKIGIHGLFGPLFFVWVAAAMDVYYLLASPLLVLSIFAISKIIKIGGVYLVSQSELGSKKACLLGIALSVRFTTSIVILQILYVNNFIQSDLYSIILSSVIVFKFITPIVFSRLLERWKVASLFEKIAVTKH